MDSTTIEWLHLALRWFHFTAGVAWIGASFYFIWLNNTLRPPKNPEPGVTGELWAIHGGGYYRVLKYHPALDKLPEPLHWFKWEAYLTWLSGFSLLLLLFYNQAALMMALPGGPLGPGAVMGVGLGSLVVGWFVYDILCRVLEKRPVLLAALGFGLIAGASWGLEQVMTGRAAYVHVGAILGTIMAGNVFRVIIPFQKAMVAATARGELADPELGKAGALRSLHNNYLTLPVLFVMLSGHFPMTFGQTHAWAVLMALFLIGATVRHFINRHEQGKLMLWLLPVAAAALFALAYVTSPRAPEAAQAKAVVSWAEVQPIFATRCVACHSANPTFAGFKAPPKGVLLDTEANARAWAPRIDAVAVQTQFMPLGNITQMTELERQMLAGWLAGLSSPRP